MANQNDYTTYQSPAARDWSLEVTPLPGQHSTQSGNTRSPSIKWDTRSPSAGGNARSLSVSGDTRSPSATGIGGMERETVSAATHSANGNDTGRNSTNGNSTNENHTVRNSANGNYESQTAEQMAAEWMQSLPSETSSQSNEFSGAWANRNDTDMGRMGTDMGRMGNDMDQIGADIENNLPDDMIEAPTTLEEVYRGSMKALLLRNLGNYVVATFLIGTQGTVSWEGILYDVGNDYLAIYQSGRDQYIVSDLYSLKYVEFYDTQRRALCDAVLMERDEERLGNG